jgi:hypothetical protein
VLSAKGGTRPAVDIYDRQLYAPSSQSIESANTRPEPPRLHRDINGNVNAQWAALATAALSLREPVTDGSAPAWSNNSSIGPLPFALAISSAV